MRTPTALSQKAKEYTRTRHLQRWALGYAATRLPCAQCAQGRLTCCCRQCGLENGETIDAFVRLLPYSNSLIRAVLTTTFVSSLLTKLLLEGRTARWLQSCSLLMV